MMHRLVNDAHNDYLQVASETGLPSLVFFLAFWALVLLRRSPRAPALRYGLLAGLPALLIHGLVDGNLTVIPSNAWFAYTMAAVLHAGVVGRGGSDGRREGPSVPEVSSPPR